MAQNLLLSTLKSVKDNNESILTKFQRKIGLICFQSFAKCLAMSCFDKKWRFLNLAQNLLLYILKSVKDNNESKLTKFQR